MMLRGLLLRLTIILFAMMLVGSSLALLIGRFTPAEMLTTTIRTVVLRGNRYSPDQTGFLLIDLNRHIRFRVPMPVDGEILNVTVWNGQEAFIQMANSQNYSYRYNLISDTLQELSLTYTEPETGDNFEVDNVFSLMNGDDEVWDYDPQTGAVYRLNVVDHTMQHVITLIDETAPASEHLRDGIIPAVSWDGTQIALVDTDMIYLFNADGSNLRRYPNPVAGDRVYGYWWQDGQYFYVYSVPDQSPTIYTFRIIDLNSGEVLTGTQNLESKSFFSNCGAQNEWLAYVDIEDQGQLLNYESGETHNLSLLPELAGKSVDSVSWFPGCEWVMVMMNVQSDNFLIGLIHRQMYIVSRDGQTAYLLSDNAALLSQIDPTHFVIAEAQATGEDIVYDVQFDGEIHRTALGSFIPDGSQLSSLQSDPYRFLVHNNQDRSVSVLDIRNGVVETYFAPNELLDFFPIQWLWK